MIRNHGYERREKKLVEEINTSKKDNRIDQIIKNIEQDTELAEHSPLSVRNTDLSNSSAGISTATGSRKINVLKKISTRNHNVSFTH